MLAVHWTRGRFGFGVPVFDGGLVFAGHACIEPEGGAHVAEVVTVVGSALAQAE